MRPRQVVLTLALVAALPLAGCTGSPSTYEERIAYLRKVAQEGAEAGNLLRAQEAPLIDKARCTRAFNGLTRPEDYPADTASGGVSKEWADQIREFWIDSCVSGKPKRTSDASTTTTTTTTSEEPPTTTAPTTATWTTTTTTTTSPTTTTP
ncbi:hypothetical protein [Actinophytocola sp.]|uniref:hypothetical protein n=1 Tax=Actinophytocola sp. TaxID=1872138 RepID=UPI00389A5332